MRRFTYALLPFLAGLFVGLGATFLINALPIAKTDVPPFPIRDEITEISLEVIYDWCSGSPDCQDYKVTFRRDGREPYYSTVTKTMTAKGTFTSGNLPRDEFDQLASLLEEQRFFDLGPGYPAGFGCADCVIKKVSAVRGTQRKRVVHLEVGEVPLSLWTIEKTIEGIEGDVQWLKQDPK